MIHSIQPCSGWRISKNALVNLWPLQKRLHERENIRRAKVSLYILLTSHLPVTVIPLYQQETWDTISSCWTPLFLRTSAAILLNQHTPDIFPPPPPLVIIFSEWKLRLRKCYAFQTVQRGRLRGYPLALHLICFVSSLDVKIKCRACSGLYFGTIATMDPCLFPQTIFFSVLSRISLKSQAIRITSTGLLWPESNTSA